MAGLRVCPAVVTPEVHEDLYEDEKKDSFVDLTSGDEPELDGIHDGLVFPTEEERKNLRRIPDKIPWGAYLIAFVELAERFSYYGSSVVFTNFIQQPLPKGSRTGSGGAHGQSGALNMGQRTSAAINTFYQFWCYVTPLYGAYIADTYWGRYKTISWAVAISMIGHILMIISSVPGIVDQPKISIGVFSLSLVIMGIGTGGFKANISPLVAEQYQKTKLFVRTLPSGEKVIVDPTLTTSTIYMYFYVFINMGALLGQIGMTYAEKYVGFWLAYTLPTIVFCLCPIILWVGRNRYVRTPPTGSVLGSAIRILRYCMRGRWSLHPYTLYKNVKSDDFWETAMPSNIQGDKPSWMTFDDQWVHEVRRGFKACAVFCWFPLCWITLNQGNLVSQAAVMTTNGLPNDVLSNLDPLVIIIFVPVCDLLIYPFLRRAKVNFGPIKKIALGFFICAAAMVWAAIVQHYIYKTSPCGYSAATCDDVSPLNVWIQTGSYVLIAFSEILVNITGLAYAFTKAPKNMRSLVMSVLLFMSAVASAICQGLVGLSADPLLVWNYGVMAAIAGISGAAFWGVTRKLDKQEDALNGLKEGHVNGG